MGQRVKAGVLAWGSTPMGMEVMPRGGDKRGSSGRASWRRGASTNTEDLADPVSSEITMEVERKQRPLCSLSEFLCAAGSLEYPSAPQLWEKLLPLAGPRGQKQPAASHQGLTRIVTSTDPAGLGGRLASVPLFTCLGCCWSHPSG